MIQSLALGLPEPDLQGNKCAHGHLKEKLPEVVQSTQMHDAQPDQAKSQERVDHQLV